jgi:large subunit ribosomal protein LP1
MTAMIKAAGCSVEAYWPSLYCKMIQSKKIGDMLSIGGGGGGGAAPAAGGDAGAAAGGAAPAKKEEVVEEEEEEMEFDLFD